MSSVRQLEVLIRSAVWIIKKTKGEEEEIGWLVLLHIIGVTWEVTVYTEISGPSEKFRTSISRMHHWGVILYDQLASFRGLTLFTV